MTLVPTCTHSSELTGLLSANRDVCDRFEKLVMTLKVILIPIIAERVPSILCRQSQLHHCEASGTLAFCFPSDGSLIFLPVCVGNRPIGDLVGDQVRWDLPPVVVRVGAHRLRDPQAMEAETRRQLKRRAFYHLRSLARKRIDEMRVERAGRARQRDLLRRKLKSQGAAAEVSMPRRMRPA